MSQQILVKTASKCVFRSAVLMKKGVFLAVFFSNFDSTDKKMSQALNIMNDMSQHIVVQKASKWVFRPAVLMRKGAFLRVFWSNFDLIDRNLSLASNILNDMWQQIRFTKTQNEFSEQLYFGEKESFWLFFAAFLNQSTENWVLTINQRILPFCKIDRFLELKKLRRFGWKIGELVVFYQVWRARNTFQNSSENV